MEFFNKAKVVRLRSHLNKFLVADDDEETVRQSRNGASVRARWTVEMVEGKSHVIRLKSCSSGKYLTPSNEPFLTGMTGKKVVQDIQANKRDTSVEWEPIKEGGLVKLRAKGGKLLRGNGGTPPWRNSVTHDLPQRTATQEWVLWGVDVVDINVALESQESFASNLSPMSSFSSTPERVKADTYSIPDINRVKAESYGSPLSNHSSPRANGSPLSNHSSPRASGRQSGMEFFHGAKAVRLKSHHNKYLVADEDQETVRQSRNGSSTKARWTVEFVEGNPNAIRFKSCHGLYLTATNEAFLLGMTGKRVQQYPAKTKPDYTTEWEPIKENAFHVKLRTCDGKFLRANGGTPPWRNSITHDVPHRTATQDWVLWQVDVVDILLSHSESVMSSLSSFSSVVDDFSGSPERIDSPRMSTSSSHMGSPSTAFKDRETKLSSGMELFRNAKSVRLKSHHEKYLLADSDCENVLQDRNGTTREAKWTVEFVNGFNNVVRLKSVYGKYLTASEDQKMMGVSGRKVAQSLPQKLNSSLDWEPIRDGFQIRLKTRYGNYLRANGGLPPWRNSITHDIPSRHHDWILWDVEIVEARPDEQEQPPSPPPETMNPDLSSSSFSLKSPKSRPAEVDDLWERPSVKNEGRMVYYTVADDDGNLDDDAYKETSFAFKGHGLEDLSRDLEEATGLDEIIICSRNPLNGKLFPLRLALPPNHKIIHIVVVPSTSKVAREL